MLDASKIFKSANEAYKREQMGSNRGVIIELPNESKFIIEAICKELNALINAVDEGETPNEDIEGPTYDGVPTW